ncbi:mechanosensitive ion channel family protein [Candidatus Woesearchaeota archaeon]|nr:MAG: mechanosensitive ion channel family protein [Candidatus Woesearchaeota archaeon]
MISQITALTRIPKEYVASVLLFVLLLIILRTSKNFIVQLLKKFAKKTTNEIDDMIVDAIERIPWFFYITLSVGIATKPLALPLWVDKGINYAITILIVFYAVRFVNNMISFFAEKQVAKQSESDKGEDTTFISIIGTITKIVVWVLAAIFLLDNFGIKVTPLIAGLGIGGIAVAFAFQNILEDLFSSFTIYFDKPFKHGDYIVIGSDSGTVEHIGLKTTRIRTLQGQELIVSNRELTSIRINNYKRMQKRRVVFNFGVVYDTPTEKLKKINKIVEKIISNNKNLELDRVHFKELGDFSLNFEVVYYINTREYKAYMDAQQEINFALKEEFEKEGIEFAYPTQSIILEK